jgi:mono/diheme cytochrome c family protein
MSPKMSRTLLNADGDLEEQRFSAGSRSKDDAGFSPGGRNLRHLFTGIALLTLAFVTAQAQKPANANVNADLPAGPMQAKATTACLECHEARIILQQRLSKGAWTKEVDKMTKWGAVIDPADRDALIDYLSANFGPDKPPYDPQRTAVSGKTSK